MSKSSKIQYQGYRTAAIISGLAIMLVTGFHSVQESFFLFPVFAAILFVFVYKGTKRFNGGFLVYLTTTKIAEIVFLCDFKRQAVIALIATMIGSIVLLICIETEMLINLKYKDSLDVQNKTRGF